MGVISGVISRKTIYTTFIIRSAIVFIYVTVGFVYWAQSGHNITELCSGYILLSGLSFPFSSLSLAWEFCYG